MWAINTSVEKSCFGMAGWECLWCQHAYWSAVSTAELGEMHGCFPTAQRIKMSLPLTALIDTTQKIPDVHVRVCMWVEVRGRHWMSSSIILHKFLARGCSLLSEFISLARTARQQAPQISLSPSPALGKAMPTVLHVSCCMGARSSHS